MAFSNGPRKLKLEASLIGHATYGEIAEPDSNVTADKIPSRRAYSNGPLKQKLETILIGNTTNEKIAEPDSNVTAEKVPPPTYPKMNDDKRNEKISERMRSISFDWTEFERVFASEFASKDGFERLVRFLTEVTGIIGKYLKLERNAGSKVLDFHHPHQLREIMEHCLHVDENPRDLEQVLSDCKETLKYCVKTGHPRFLNQLSTGLDVIGMAGEWVTAAANTNMFTYETAPVFTLMEEVVLARMLAMIGWDGGEGIFSPGGAISNFYAMLAARHCACPDVKQEGMVGATQFAVFTSEQSHFSIKKAAVLLGIGLNNVYCIKSDKRGKMIPSALLAKVRECIEKGRTPLMVNATCGTTVLGAFDLVDEIADICENYGIWLHIDGAWGGSVLFSDVHRHLLHGIHRANSMTWNPHKMMGVPLQCSAIFLKEKGVLASANSLGAVYLFQRDKLYDTQYDTGDRAIQCGRHNDIFKLWLMWRSKGDKGFAKQIDRNFELASYLLDKLKQHAEFKLVLEQIEGPNVCFWYVPEVIRSMTDPVQRNQALHQATARLKSMMMVKGSMMIQYQPMGELPNFFRVVFSNPAITTNDVDFVVSELLNLGSQL